MPILILLQFYVDIFAGSPYLGLGTIVQAQPDRLHGFGMYCQWIGVESLVGNIVPMGDLAGIAFEEAAVFGQRDFPACAVHQLHSEDALQLGNILAHSRLRNMQSDCGSRKAAAIHNCQKNSDSLILQPMGWGGGYLPASLL